MDKMDMTAIHKTSMVDEVFRVLHDHIVSGDLKPGDRLPTQSQLSEQLSVSRNTVREAIRKLTVMGLVDGKPGVGMTVQVSTPARYVGSLSPHLLLDQATAREFLEARLYIEKIAVRLAVLRATGDDIDILRGIIDRQKIASRDNDLDQFNDLDAEFHLKLARLGRNDVLVKFLETIRDLLHKFISEVNQMPGAVKQAISYHSEITDFIADRDAAAAERSIVEHLHSVVHTIQRNLGMDLDLETLFEMELRTVNKMGRRGGKKAKLNIPDN
jgi:GntR family transcriptional regulator, transcriptional repressor for pyruvate dehydrogenase complex